MEADCVQGSLWRGCWHLCMEAGRLHGGQSYAWKPGLAWKPTMCMEAGPLHGGQSYAWKPAPCMEDNNVHGGWSCA
eukprot:350486-Chlamydomonas_euryale.AAC.3